jgi:hypothetical protein
METTGKCGESPGHQCVGSSERLAELPFMAVRGKHPAFQSPSKARVPLAGACPARTATENRWCPCRRRAKPADTRLPGRVSAGGRKKGGGTSAAE